MALIRITDGNRRGQYMSEVREFLDTGWNKAITDIYPDKNPETKLMGFKQAIRQLGVEEFIKVNYDRTINEFTLERY